MPQDPSNRRTRERSKDYDSTQRVHSTVGWEDEEAEEEEELALVTRSGAVRSSQGPHEKQENQVLLSRVSGA
jgi:hypothetical protein